MPEDEGLRVGRWVPPYSAEPEPGNPPARPALPRMPERRALGPGRSAPPQSARHFLILAAVAALGCGITAIVALNRDGGAEPVAQQSYAPRPDLPAFPLEPELTIPLLPAPTSKLPTLSAVAPVATRSYSASAKPSPSASATSAGGANPTATTAPPAPAPPPVVGLSVGTTVGLELVDRPGFRIRHQNFAGRIGAISPADSQQVRNDARFTIRTGRASSNCFSLESVNFPGYYLRHQNYQIKLDRVDGSNLYDQDSTFCSQSIRSGTAITLRSHNYPSRYVAVNGDRLVITEQSALALRPGTL
jgi:hypothetical protein